MDDQEAGLRGEPGLEGSSEGGTPVEDQTLVFGVNERLGAGNLRRRPATRQQDQRPGPQQDQRPGPQQGVSDEAAGRHRQGRVTEAQ